MNCILILFFIRLPLLILLDIDSLGHVLYSQRLGSFDHSEEL